jgi:hypothetical protein
MAADGLGVEDEPQPPAPVERGPGLWSARDHARLGADWIRWKPGTVLAWKVIAKGNLQDTQQSARSARIDAADLPSGYAAWAVSKSRGLKFRLLPGAGIPLGAGSPDSLDVLAGPEALLAARLAAIPAAVQSFRLEASARPGGWRLRADLPHAARIAVTLWSLDGRALDRAVLDLAPGFHDLDRPARLPAGLAVLRAEWSGDGRKGSLVRKLTLP